MRPAEVNHGASRISGEKVSEPDKMALFQLKKA
jgi:hypothetical protein